jgi:hypothetical protein
MIPSDEDEVELRRKLDGLAMPGAFSVMELRMRQTMAS